MACRAIRADVGGSARQRSRANKSFPTSETLVAVDASSGPRPALGLAGAWADRLELRQAGILAQRNVGRQRYRVFEATAVVDLFTGLERTLASLAGDTAVAPPTRHVPCRPIANSS